MDVREPPDEFVASVVGDTPAPFDEARSMDFCLPGHGLLPAGRNGPRVREARREEAGDTVVLSHVAVAESA